MIVRVGPEMGKIFRAVMDVHDKNTNCRGTKKDTTKVAESFFVRKWSYKDRARKANASKGQGKIIK